MNRACKHYLRQVRRWLPGTMGKKRAILARIREDMMQYLEENKDPAEAQLHQRFGTPQQIASAYVDEMDTMALLKDLRLRRRVVTVITCAALTAILIWLAAVGIALWDSFENSRGSVDDGVIEVIQ